jgi:hypothetical protein
VSLRSPILADVPVRQLLTYAIDRRATSPRSPSDQMVDSSRPRDVAPAFERDPTRTARQFVVERA